MVQKAVKNLFHSKFNASVIQYNLACLSPTSILFRIAVKLPPFLNNRKPGERFYYKRSFDLTCTAQE